MDKVIGMAQARENFPFYLKAVSQGKRFIVAQRSHPRAVLISPEELETLEVSADKKLLEDLKKAQQDIVHGRVLKAENYFSKKKK